MKKSSILSFVFLMFCYCSSFSQSSQTSINTTNEHDKMLDFYLKSQDVKLPDSIYVILKNYAFNKSLKEVSVLRNDYVFKVLYNSKISIADKLFACDFFIKANSGPYPYVPVFLLKSIQLDLLALNKK